MIYPDYDKFKKLSENYEKITIYKEIPLYKFNLNILNVSTLAPSTFNLISNFNYSFFLESANIDKTFSRFSFAGFNPEKVIIGINKEVTIFENNKTYKIDSNIVDYLEKNYPQKSQYINENFGDFAGGLVGFFGYETVNFMDILRKPVKISHEIHSVLFEVNKFFVFDNLKNKFYAAVCVSKEDDYNSALEKLHDFTQKLFENKKISFTFHLHPSTLKIEKEYSDKKFLNKISEIKNEIIDGEAIQVVLSRKYEIFNKVNPVSFYMSLKKINPSPYMFFIKFNDYVLLGSSPETHLKVKNNTAILKPIAGTYPAGKDLNKISKNLLNDEKERAEHLMLLDLARNDLYQGCEVESVNVKRAFEIEAYSHVVHIVSEITGRLKHDTTPFQLFLKTFPAGTVSGAPKVRAIELIDEYEESERNFYSGCVGYLNYNHSLDTCITIRSALFKNDRIVLRAGAGIVADSIEEKEILEVEKKLMAMFKAMEGIKNVSVNR